MLTPLTIRYRLGKLSLLILTNLWNQPLISIRQALLLAVGLGYVFIRIFNKYGVVRAIGAPLPSAPTLIGLVQASTSYSIIISFSAANIAA